MYSPNWKILTIEKVDNIISKIIHERAITTKQEERIELDELKCYWEETRKKIVLFNELIK